MFFWKNRVGLDIGQHSVKTAVLSSDGKKIVYLAQSEIENKKEYFEDKPTEDAIYKAVIKSLDKYAGSNSSIVSLIRGEGMTGKYVELPPLSDKELEVAVPSVVHKMLPFSLNEVNLNYIAVPLLNPDDKKRGVFFTAVKKSVIESHKAMLERFKIDIVTTETPYTALAKEFARNHPGLNSVFSVIIHIGDSMTCIIVVRGGYPYYARELSMAGADFTYALQMGYQSPWTMVEAYKKEYDLYKCEPNVEAIFSNWGNDVKRSIDFFLTQFPGQTLKDSKVYLSGGSALTKNLDKRMEEYLGMQVMVDQWDKLTLPREYEKESYHAIFNVALGLAMQ